MRQFSSPCLFFLQSLFSLLAGGILLGQVASGQQSAIDDPKATALLRPVETQRPNIIFFLSDDHRHDQLGCAGHPFLQTPTIDDLAKRGIRFTHAYVTTSICAASRASSFTGLVERTHGYTFRTMPLAQKFVDQSYPALLKKAGYRTGFVGKFGVSVPKNGVRSMFDFYEPRNRNPYFKIVDGKKRHVTEIIGDKAIEFLDSVKGEQPFCLQVSFNAGHAEDGDKENHFPWPQAVDGLYDNVELGPPRLSDPEIFESQPDFLRKSFNRVRYSWRWDTQAKYEKNLRAYLRMLTGLDRVMGRVLRHVDQLGKSDNTVVIFSGDNGYYMGQRGFAGKWSHYDESLRVPLVIHDPRVGASAQGTTSKAIALNIDIPATLLDLAGVKPPQLLQGRSLMPFVSQQDPQNWRTEFFCEHLMHLPGKIPKWEGVHDHRYVYARYFEQKPPYVFLHDLEKDPDQLKNFADDPEYSVVLADLSARCDRLRDEYGGEYSLQKYPINRPRPRRTPEGQGKK